MGNLKALLLAVFILFFAGVKGQIFDPVLWNVEVKELGDDTYELISTAQLEDGWHIYSQYGIDPLNIPTEFRFYDTQDNYTLLGSNEELGTYKEYSDVSGGDVFQFKDVAIFKQKVKLINTSLDYILAQVVYQACDDEKCLPPNPEVLLFKIKGTAQVPEDLDTIVEAFYDNGDNGVKAQSPDLSNLPLGTPGIEELETVEKISQEAEDNDLSSIFIFCLIAGFGALLTPCVYPMIPMTVSYFTKSGGSVAQGKFQGLLYGFFILLIYVLCSLPFYLFETVSPDIFNEFSTNPYLNIFFFIIFVLFAISFFGAFEITMPNSLVNKVDNASSVGGIIGVFFMALTLVLVSFSCTGPVIGGVLGSVLSSDGGAVALSTGLAGFGMGIGIPFALFAIFPGWLNKLPKSGGWLNTVKVFLGFIELAFAFKFLSNADLVWQAGLLPREVFIAIWIAIFGALTFYLFGKIKLPHDDNDDRISVGRLLMAITTLFFTLYMIPGLWGAPLKIISGFPPSTTYSESPHGFMSVFTGEEIDIPEGAHLGVHDIIAFDDYQKGLDYAQAVGKPVLIDFTGWACVNCRKMEERVWGDPQILELLKNDVVLVSLYVDERKLLEDHEQFKSQITGKSIRTVGNKWSDLQIAKYKVNAQPFYAMVDPNGNDLIQPIGYTPDVKLYRDWLKSGIKN